MNPPAKVKGTTDRLWVWVLAWVVFSLAVAGFSLHSHRKFSSAIAEAFNQQQGLGVRLIERMVQQHINEAMLLLAHVKDEIRESAGKGRPDFTSTAASAIAARRIDQFISVSVIDEDGRVLYASQPSVPWNPLTLARVEKLDPENRHDALPLRAGLHRRTGQPTVFVFVPFRLRGAEGAAVLRGGGAEHQALHAHGAADRDRQGHRAADRRLRGGRLPHRERRARTAAA